MKKKITLYVKISHVYYTLLAIYNPEEIDSNPNDQNLMGTRYKRKVTVVWMCFNWLGPYVTVKWQLYHRRGVGNTTKVGCKIYGLSAHREPIKEGF